MADDGPMAYFDEKPPQDEHPRRRPTRACTARTAARLAPPAPAPAPPPRSTSAKKKPAECEPPVGLVLTPPLPGQNDRWQLRNMWELASVIDFFRCFRPVLGFEYDFTGEDLESALLVPNSRLDDIHLALLKAIPPAARIALTRDTWVTVLCKKLKDWWHKVGDGPCPLVANHGLEIEVYKGFDPGMRLQILKALCEIRVDQDDLRGFIDVSMKDRHTVFRKEPLGDIFGTTYWYEEDMVLGQRLYRELPRIEPKTKAKGQVKGRSVPPPGSGQWETVATNFTEFQDVVERLCGSRNKAEVNLGRKINTDIMPFIEELHKKKERALKKQARQAMLLESCMTANGLAGGRSRRDRKPVTYTFDDYDRSISEAIKFTKKKNPSPEPPASRRDLRNQDARSNGGNGRPEYLQRLRGFSGGNDGGHEEAAVADMDQTYAVSLRSGRQPRPTQRYPDNEYVDSADGEALSDEEIVGEAVFKEDYLQRRRQRREASSERDYEYRMEEDEFDPEEEVGANADSDYVDSGNESSGYEERRGGGKRAKSQVEVEKASNWGLRRSTRLSRGADRHEQFDSEMEEVDEEAEGNYRVDRGYPDVDKEAEDRGADESQGELSAGSEQSADDEEDPSSRQYEERGDMVIPRPSMNGRGGNAEHSHDHRPESSFNEAGLNGYPLDDAPSSGSTKLRLRLHRPPPAEALRKDAGNDGRRVDRLDSMPGGLQNGKGGRGSH